MRADRPARDLERERRAAAMEGIQRNGAVDMWRREPDEYNPPILPPPTMLPYGVHEMRQTPLEGYRLFCAVAEGGLAVRYALVEDGADMRAALTALWDYLNRYHASDSSSSADLRIVP